MFRVKNTSRERQNLVKIVDNKPLSVSLKAGEISEPINEWFLNYFLQNAIEWLMILPEREETEIKSIGEPILELPKKRGPKPKGKK